MRSPLIRQLVRRTIVSGLAASLLTLCLVGCGGDGQTDSSEWTVERGALMLERDLVVSDTDSFYFGKIKDLAVAGDGRMCVADLVSKDVKVLGPDGGPQQTLGTAGAGPGEFQQPEQVVLARGDSVYVMDWGRGRISVFDETGQFAYGLGIGAQGLPELMVPDEPGFVVAHTSFSVDSLEDRRYLIRRVSTGGEAGDTLVVGQSTTWHSPARGLSIGVPFAPDPHAALGPQGRILYARGDSLSVTSYRLGGKRVSTISIPFDPVPVTDEEREEALERYTGKRSIPSDIVPSIKPAFYYFLVDDRGRYWFGRPTNNPDSTDWWVADPTEKRVVTTTLPSEVQLMTVKDGRAYGRTTTENGAPAVVRYQVRAVE